MEEHKKYVDIEIDKLTNSIENAISGDSFDTEINILTKQELKSITKGNGWKFDWKYEFEQNERTIYKLSIKNNTDVIQGLVSCSDESDHIFMYLIESAPFNIGKNKVYIGVPGNLVAFLCKESWDRGYEGFVSFLSKTKLVEHYEKMLGAIHIGNHKMIIFPKDANNILNKKNMIREPKNIEFEVISKILTSKEKKQISDIISHYKKTGEVKKITKEPKKKIA